MSAFKGNWAEEVPGIKDRPGITETNAEQVPEVILVKFNFTNERWVPKGIQKKERTQSGIKEADRGFKVPGSYERVRPGRVDTGKHQEVRNVVVKQFLNELKEAGFCLTGSHYFEKESKGYTVVTEWTHAPLPIEKGISEETREGLRVLSEIFGWGVCHLWQNPRDAVTSKIVWTVNLTNLVIPAKFDQNTKALSFKRWASSRPKTRLR